LSYGGRSRRTPSEKGLYGPAAIFRRDGGASFRRARCASSCALLGGSRQSDGFCLCECVCKSKTWDAESDARYYARSEEIGRAECAELDFSDIAASTGSRIFVKEELVCEEYK
jgi:hypothetical protein